MCNQIPIERGSRKEDTMGNNKSLASAARFSSLHKFQAPWEVRLQTEFRPQESTRLLQPLDVPSDLPRRVFSARGRQSQAHNVQHAVVESVIELGPAACVGVVVPTVVAAVGVEVSTQLDDEFKGEGGAARQC